MDNTLYRQNYQKIWIRFKKAYSLWSFILFVTFRLLKLLIGLLLLEVFLTLASLEDRLFFSKLLKIEVRKKMIYVKSYVNGKLEVSVKSKS